jgi:hypothetical protein
MKDKSLQNGEKVISIGMRDQQIVEPSVKIPFAGLLSKRPHNNKYSCEKRTQFNIVSS